MLLAAAVAPAATVYVAPQGQPATLAGARDAVRALRQKGERDHVDVILRGAVYRLDETFVLTAEDSDVTYAAQPGDRVVIGGGRRIEGWNKGTGPVWTAPAAWNFRQLFVNGGRALRARTPTNGFFRIDGDSSRRSRFG